MVTEELKQLKATIASGKGEYQDFLNRWGYDRQQQEVIEQVIAQVI